MGWVKKIIEGIIGSEDLIDIKTSSARDFLNGNILTKKYIKKQYGLIIMVAVLAFLYVDNRYYCETQLAKEVEMKKKIQDLKYESLTISAELMQLSRQSKVLEMINSTGVSLKRSATPPVVIEDSIAE